LILPPSPPVSGGKGDANGNNSPKEKAQDYSPKGHKSSLSEGGQYSVGEDEDSQSAFTENLSEGTNSMGDWSSDEDEEPKLKLNVVIKPRTEAMSASASHIPAISVGAPLSAGKSFIGRKRNKSLPPSPLPSLLKHSTSDTSIKQPDGPENKNATVDSESTAKTHTGSTGSNLDLMFGKPEPRLVKEWSIGKILGFTQNETQARDSAADSMKSAMVDLENGNFDTSLMYIGKAISQLGSVPTVSTLQQEIEYCVRYKMALNILVKMNIPETSPLQGAYLSRILAGIPLKPVHRVICIRMAVKRNIKVGNYNIAYTLLQYLVSRVKPMDIEAINTKLDFCDKNGRINLDERFSKYACQCGVTSNVGAFACSCGQLIKYCAKTLELIDKKSYLMCRICKLNFAATSGSVGRKCYQCGVGVLEFKITYP